jgi:arylformamidase
MAPWIDLSHPLTPGTPSYPGDPPLEARTLASVEADGYALAEWRATFHAGTHIDAPAHFMAGGARISDLPPERFVGDAVLIAVTPSDRPPLGPEILERAPRWEDANFVLFRTGWSDRYGTPAYFEGFPTLSEALAERLACAGLTAVGVDAPSVDPHPSVDPDPSANPHPPVAPYPAHRILLGAGVCLLENLTGLRALPEGRPFRLLAVPPSIEAEAMWVRPMAWLPDSDDR